MLRTTALRTHIPTAARAASGLVLAESGSKAGTVNKATLAAITAASAAVGGPVDVLVASSSVSDLASAAASVSGVGKVLTVEAPELGASLAEHVSAALSAAVEAGGYTHVAAGATVSGKNIIPRAGAAFAAQPISDVMEVAGEDTFVRPIYAGNALATVQSSDDIKFFTVRATAFDPAPETGGDAPVEALPVPDFPLAGKVAHVKDEMAASDKPDLASAPVVVSGGRGLKAGENFAMLSELADLLGGAVGASRAAVDDGMADNSLQVGQTGSIVAPDLYIAVGISGAIQHISGMSASKVIVAINKDPDAPIFSIADYGLVADLFEAVPELTQKIQAARS